MLLPTIILPITLDVFSTQLTYLLHAFMGASDVQIILETVKSGEHLRQFEVLSVEPGSRKDKKDLCLFGQLSAFPRTDDQLEIQSACLHYKREEIGVQFFNFLFAEFVKKWGQHNPFRDYPFQEWVDGFLGTLSDDYVESLISDLISEYGFDPQRYKSPIDLPKSVRDPEKEAQRKKLVNQLRQGLPDIDKISVAKTDKEKKSKRGLTKRTFDRADAIKRIKDNHLGWSQTKVAMEATVELNETITPDIVRYIYRKMGWTWERADRIR